MNNHNTYVEPEPTAKRWSIQVLLQLDKIRANVTQKARITWKEITHMISSTMRSS